MCRMCAAEGEDEAAQAEQRYLTERRALLFSGTVPSQESEGKHWCRNDEEYGKMERPMQVTEDGPYTESWCRHCMRYMRMMIPTSSRSRSI